MLNEIRLGKCYRVQLTTREAVVRIEDYGSRESWVSRDLSHGRKVVVRASQIVCRCDENGIRAVADETIPNRRSKALPPDKKEPSIIESSTPPPPVAHGPMSLLDAAALVLRGSRKPMSTREIVSLVIERKLWESTGATPWATLNAALNRDIAANGSKSRFVKKTRGKYGVR